MGFDTSVHAGIRVRDWKLLTGEQGMDSWVEPPESHVSTEYHDVDQLDHPGYQMFNHKPVQLFNIKYDPEERVEVSDLYPEIVDELLARLVVYNKTAVPVVFPPEEEEADPARLGGFWQPWVK